MIENIYVLFDLGSGIALKPAMIDRNDVAPLRVLGDTAQNPESLVSKHPNEFQLIHVGTIDLETLTVQALQHPRVVATASDMLPKNE